VKEAEALAPAGVFIAEPQAIRGGGDDAEYTDLRSSLHQDKLLLRYQKICREASRKVNPLVNRSLIESAAADDETLAIDAPGNHPHTFCDRLQDADIAVLKLSFLPAARFLSRLDLSYNRIGCDRPGGLQKRAYSP